MGVQKSNITVIVALLPIVLHLALFLFLCGLAVFFRSLHTGLSYIVITLLGVTIITYATFNCLPLIYPDSPTS